MLLVLQYLLINLWLIIVYMYHKYYATNKKIYKWNVAYKIILIKRKKKKKLICCNVKECYKFNVFFSLFFFISDWNCCRIYIYLFNHSTNPIMTDLNIYIHSMETGKKLIVDNTVPYIQIFVSLEDIEKHLKIRHLFPWWENKQMKKKLKARLMNLNCWYYILFMITKIVSFEGSNLVF